LKFHCYYIYILECSDNTFYTGVTNDLSRRLEEHQSGINNNSYTHNRRPVKLVFSCEFNNIEVAIAKEKQIKKWSKAKKNALINGDFDLLPELSKKKFD